MICEDDCPAPNTIVGGATEATANRHQNARCEIFIFAFIFISTT
jgi:hypothetical protein